MDSCRPPRARADPDRHLLRAVRADADGDQGLVVRSRIVRVGSVSRYVQPGDSDLSQLEAVDAFDRELVALRLDSIAHAWHRAGFGQDKAGKRRNSVVAKDEAIVLE